MQRLTIILSTAAIALWIGSVGGGMVGYSNGLTDASCEIEPTNCPTDSGAIAQPNSSAAATEDSSEPAESTTIAGPTGLTGPQGLAGNAGPMGPVGPQGAMGPQGAAGEQGPQGLPGEPGAQGPQGEAGPQGITGAMGPQGTPGAVGATGPMGPVGPVGPSGVVAATSPATYDASSKTIGVDQAAFTYLERLGYLQFNTSSSAAAEIGRLRWNASDGTLDLSLGGGNVTLQIGQETVIPVKNVGPSTLLNGRAVRITGAVDGVMTVGYADASNPALTSAVVGLLTQDIPAGQIGYVTAQGLIRDVDTSFGNSGDQVYVDAGGTLTAVRPMMGAVMSIGYVVNRHATQGSILVSTNMTYAPGPGLPCHAGPNFSLGVYKWEEDGNNDYYLSCDITP